MNQKKPCLRLARSLVPSFSLFLLFSHGLRPAVAGELRETLVFANGAFMMGRLEEAASSYRYATALDPNHIEAALDLALVLRDMGRGEEALPLWVKATFLAPQDPAVWEGRAWACLSLGRFEEAQEYFSKAIHLSTGPVSWTASFGSGVGYYLDEEPSTALRVMKSAMMQAPLTAAPKQLLAMVYERTEAEGPALDYYQRSLQSDPWMREAQKGLMRLLQKARRPESAWQVAYSLQESDPQDPEIRKRLSGLKGSLTRRPEDLMPIRRLPWPLLQKASAAPAGLDLRIALFADGGGRPAEVSSFTWIANTPFRIVDSRLGEVSVGHRMEAWRASLEPVEGLLMLRSVRGTDTFATKNSVELVPFETGGDLLIKDVSATAAPGRDLGDRELRGKLLITPSREGLRLSLETADDDYLRGALAVVLPGSPYIEALKALAVVLRSRIRFRVGEGTLHPGAPWTLCDSSHCGVYLGIQEEYPEAARAVQEMRGMSIGYRGRPIEALDHPACGGRTQSAEGMGKDVPYLSEVLDMPRFPLESPFDLERYTGSLPPENLWCLATHPANVSLVRWARVLQAADVEERLKRLGLKGRLKALIPGRRSSTGRLMELQAVGSRGTMILKGDEAIAQALSPGSLRSTLFIMRTLKKKGRPHLFLLFGVGTGHGMGLCRAGAEGMASSGSDFKAILNHYFPGAELQGQTSAAERKGKTAAGKPGK